MRPLVLAATLACAAALTAAAAARPPSPARYLWAHTNAPRGALVAVHCHHATGRDFACELVVQPAVRRRSCWRVVVHPTPRAWRVMSVSAIAHARCPLLHGESRGGRALKA